MGASQSGDYQVQVKLFAGNFILVGMGKNKRTCALDNFQNETKEKSMAFQQQTGLTMSNAEDYRMCYTNK